MGLRHWVTGIGFLGAVWSPCAFAGGFYIQEQNAAGVGRAQAGDVAAADDASTIYFNPAGMTELHGIALTLGADVVIPGASLTDKGSRNTSTGAFIGNPASGGVSTPGGSNGGDPGSAVPIPDFFISAPLANTGLSIGLGMSAPFGLKSRYTSNSFARYDSIDNLLETADFAPSLAWKVNDWLSIGAGLDEQYALVKLTTALPNPLVPGGPTVATDGNLALHGHDWATGFNVGILLKPMDGTKIGISYRSAITHNFNGRVTFAGLAGPLAARNGTVGAAAALNLPDIVAVGISQQVTSKLTLLGEVDYTGWSKFSQIAIHLADGSGTLVTPENYRDTWSPSIGGEYQLTDTLKLRAGVKYDETPTVDGSRDTRVPDGNRVWVAGGLGWAFSDQLSFDASYAHIFVTSSSINVTRSFYAGAPFPVPTTSNIVASSAVKINIFTLGLNYLF